MRLQGWIWHRVHPAQGQQVRIGFPAFREEDGIAQPTPRAYGIYLGCDDIVVTTQHGALAEE